MERMGPELAATRSSRGGGDGGGFDDGLHADDFAARREVSSLLKELTMRVDGKGGSCNGNDTDQQPKTPRSKHFATEQRRHSKTNDRSTLFAREGLLSDRWCC